MAAAADLVFQGKIRGEVVGQKVVLHEIINKTRYLLKHLVAP